MRGSGVVPAIQRQKPTRSSDSTELRRFERRGDGARLAVSVAPPDGRVAEVELAVPEFEKSHARWKEIHERLGDLLIGERLQEGSEHAIGRLELQLRDFDRPPVPGVVQPENVDDRFAVVLRLLRGIYDEYRRAIGETPGRNDDDPQLRRADPEWETCDDAGRVDWIERVATDFLREETSDAVALGVTEIQGGTRVFVAWTSPVTSGAESDLLRWLERALRLTIDPRLEVFLEPKPDRNWLRRRATERRRG
ncbi:MAG: hypothetical protein KDC38_12125 [Planctomycetes bacterium]|nr:hypothetical protein [Planctomycetota bacterium]